MSNNNKNKLEIFKANPSKALWTLSIPMMLGMSVQAIYMLIDTAFIGKWHLDNPDDESHGMQCLVCMLSDEAE